MHIVFQWLTQNSFQNTSWWLQWVYNLYYKISRNSNTEKNSYYYEITRSSFSNKFFWIYWIYTFPVIDISNTLFFQRNLNFYHMFIYLLFYSVIPLSLMLLLLLRVYFHTLFLSNAFLPNSSIAQSIFYSFIFYLFLDTIIAYNLYPHIFSINREILCRGSSRPNNEQCCW